MIFFPRLNIIIEIVVRVVLWLLFVWFDEVDPFIRKIQPQEVWLYQYPVTDSYVPSQDLWIIITLFPVLFLATEYFVGKTSDDDNRNDILNAILALTLGYSLNGFLTSFLKVMVGRPRPVFYHRCFPEGAGTDFTKCTGDRHMYMDGRKSFPSGHSSFSFTCMMFMTLYIARKCDFRNDSKGGRAWKLCACILPILVAASIAISRTCDYHHHYEDVISGSLLGIAIACLTYWMYFPKKTAINITDK